MSNRTEDLVYCANDLCENAAEYLIPRTKTPLCGVCAVAWEWGRENTEDTALEAIPPDKAA